MTTTFRALVVSEKEERQFVREIKELTTDQLPDGDVLIRVHRSSLNYKDALSATGNRGVTRHFPHTPGIDAAGVVAASSVDTFSEGDEVVVIGYDLGMNTAGGFGQYIRVPAGWVVPLPEGLTMRESMIYGTAGFTAAQSVYALRQAGVTPDQGPIVVTGATGGVGSVAVALLAKLGYETVAVTGKRQQADFLKSLGASEVVGRQELDDQSGRPLLKERWAGAVDTVGGNMLVTLLKSIHYGGSVTCCGLVASHKLEATVYPFILRGISLLGIDSVNCDIALRREIWALLAGDWKIDHLASLAQDRKLEDLDKEIGRILQGQQVGRIVVNLD